MKDEKLVLNDEVKSFVEETVKGAVAGVTEEIKKANEEASKKRLETPKASKSQKLADFVQGIYEVKILGMADGFKKIEGATGKSVNTLTDGAGGYLIPQEWASMIDKAERDFGVIEKLATVFPMPTKVYNLPKGANNTTGYWVGETSAITESNPTFGETELSVKKVAGISTVSNEALRFASANLVEYITKDIAESIAIQIDTEALNGDGSNPAITGIFQSSDVTDVAMAVTKDSFTDLGYDYLINLKNGVPHQRRNGSSWLMSDSVFGLVQKLKDSAGNPIYQPLASQEMGLLLGYPVVLSNNAPELDDDAPETSFMAFGNFKRGAVLGVYGGYSIDISKDAVVNSNSMFEKDMSAVRVIKMVDFKVHLGGYLSKLTTGATS